MNLIEQIKVNDTSIDGYQGTYYDESSEWAKVILDSEDKVLAGIKKEGNFFSALDLNVNGSIITEKDVNVQGIFKIQDIEYTLITSDDYIKAIVDSQYKVLCGITRNGKFIADIDGLDDKTSGIIISMMNNYGISIKNNIDYAFVELDNDDKMISAVSLEGKKIFFGDIHSYGKINGVDIKYLSDSFEEEVSNNKEISDALSYVDELNEEIMKINPNSVYINHLLLKSNTGKIYELVIDDVENYPRLQIIEN